MTDRIASDHDAVASHRVRVESVGRTRRHQVTVPDDVGVSAGDVIRCSLEGDETNARVTETLREDLAVRGAFDNARLARTDGEGEDRLAVWLDECGLEDGDQLLLDVVTEGYAYGLRRPGERVIYAAREAPDDTLADIARDVQD